MRIVKYSGPDEALPREPHRPDLRVVDDVRDQEQRGGDERGEHEAAVQVDLPRADQQEPDQQEDAGDAVERRVDRRQIVNRHT